MPADLMKASFAATYSRSMEAIAPATAQTSP